MNANTEAKAKISVMFIFLSELLNAIKSANIFGINNDTSDNIEQEIPTAISVCLGLRVLLNDFNRVSI